MFVKNPDHNQEIKCLWCSAEYTRIANELWYNPFKCLKCGKDMGVPVGEAINVKGIHTATSYRFQCLVNKTKLVKFIRAVVAVESVWIPNDDVFYVSVCLYKPIQFEGVEFKNPPMAVAC